MWIFRLQPTFVPCNLSGCCFLCSIQSLPRTTRMAPSSKLGKRECTTCTVKALNADIKVTVDATRPTTALYAHATMGILQPPKVTVLGSRLLRVFQAPLTASATSDPVIIAPAAPAIRYGLTYSETSSPNIRQPDMFRFNLLPIRDAPKTVLPHP